KQMADPTFGMVPKAQVTKGETWTRTAEQNLGPIGSYTNTYKYSYQGPDEKNKDLELIKVETTLTYKTPSEIAEGLPFRIKSANLTSKDGGGTITFDTKKGRMERSDLKLKLEGDIQVEIGGMTTKVDLKQEQTTTVQTSDTSLLGKKQ